MQSAPRNEQHDSTIGESGWKAELGWWLWKSPRLNWRFATTMADTPHSYVVRGRTLPEQDFDRAVRVIRRFGRPGKFYGRTMIYLIVNGRKWWTMGEALEECRIINTTDDLRPYGKQDQVPETRSGHRDGLFDVYDRLAPDYDRRYATPECAAENRWVWQLLTGHFPLHPVTLDIGCGTGLLLDLGVTDANRYTGLDPSQGMLNELLRKHPEVTRLVPATFEEALARHQLHHQDYQLVTVLFGSASYLHPQAIEQIPLLCTGLAMLMCYEEGYLPDYHTEVPEHLDSSRRAARGLLAEYPGTTVHLGRFQVTLITRDFPLAIPPTPDRVNLSRPALVLSQQQNGRRKQEQEQVQAQEQEQEG